MRRWFRKKPPDAVHETGRLRFRIIPLILMMIGLLTVLYFLIVYAIIPLLALLTV